MAAATSSSSTAPKLHIAEQPITWRNWANHVNWLNFVILILVPIWALYRAYYTPLQFPTAVWAITYYFWTGLGITAGYHRLWAHRSYSASLPLRLWLAALGGGAVEGSIRWWSRDHRSHHRFTDTMKDPYSVQRGLLFSHLGWLMVHKNPKHNGRVDISDLNQDPVVVWQHRNYVKVLLLFGILVPTLVAGLGWGDWFGGFLYAGILRIFFVQQATFCVNSLAHYLGDQPFDDRNSPRDHAITALVTLGEGYHNFHHQFPSDYRNAISWWQYDPTKWSIVLWKWMGLAFDLKTFPRNEIEKGRYQQSQKELDSKRAALDWGVPIQSLPVIEWDDFVERAQTEALIVIAGVVHDLTTFIPDHPGGKALITSAIGKDATAVFNGGVYDHSNAAHNLLSKYRVSVVRGGGHVEIWSKIARGPGDKVVDNGFRAGEQPTRIPDAVMATSQPV